MRSLLAAVLLVAACGVRAPAPIDVATLVATRGPVEAHRDLVILVLAHPRDVQAHLALAALADKLGRPTEAIEQLEIVERLGGPIGVRWHDDDRARLGRLLLARGRARLARGSQTALADLERAGKLGVRASEAELGAARLAYAIGLLRHVDPELRAKGRAIVAARAKGAKPGSDEAIWAGAERDATPAEHGAFGAWLWTVGARRESYEQLVQWHGGTPAPRNEALQGSYLRAVAWWLPISLGEVPPPPADELVGPERCWFPSAGCQPPVAPEPPLPPIVSFTDPQLPPRAIAAARYASTHTELSPTGQGVPNVAGATGPGDANADAELAAIAAAFARDPVVAERFGRDFVAAAIDSAAAHAALGALFDALGDPGRARTNWAAAVDSSVEPSFQRGLAEATARVGAAPAAMVVATAAAAASGDPAVVWTAVADALIDSAQYVEALIAARNAIDLAGPVILPRALDVAIAASRALRRTVQADRLLVQRAQLAAGAGIDDADAKAAVDAHRAGPTASTAARLWVVSRTHPRDVEVRAALLTALPPDDARRPAVTMELVELAGDPDPERALAAVAALR